MIEARFRPGSKKQFNPGGDSFLLPVFLRPNDAQTLENIWHHESALLLVTLMTHYLDAAIDAARAAGKLLRQGFEQPQNVNVREAHDIKLEIDVQTQDLITDLLLKKFPEHALYGEEGIVGDQSADHQWVVDPLDGTVNFFYGIPHFCTSIALRFQKEIIVGVIYDPMRDEMWTAQKGSAPQLNGRPIRVSDRKEIGEAVISVGLSKTGATIDAGLPLLQDLVHRARKCRLMGSAALDMAYVACGRFDAYIEQGISLWDIAAGIILVETAGGKVDMRPRTDTKDKFSIIASNGMMDLGLSK